MYGFRRTRDPHRRSGRRRSGSLAVETVNEYTGTVFGSPDTTTFIVNDVHKHLVVLPTPVADATSVTVSGQALDSTYWVLEDWGIRIYNASPWDVDGFPRLELTDGLMDWQQGDLYGASVAVSATFGYPTVPARVRRATIMLAACYATDDLSGQVPDSWLKQLSVEGYRVGYDDTNANMDTTGDLSVDRLLQGYLNVCALVG